MQKSKQKPQNKESQNPPFIPFYVFIGKQFRQFA
jgi:hypothetical protein